MRELERVVQAALIRQRGGVFLPEDLVITLVTGESESGRARVGLLEVSAGDGSQDGEPSEADVRTLDEVMRTHILKTLRACREVSGAAERLGLKRSTLYDHMNRLEIRREAFDLPRREP